MIRMLHIKLAIFLFLRKFVNNSTENPWLNLPSTHYVFIKCIDMGKFRYKEITYTGMYLNKYLNGHYQTKLVIRKLARSLGMLSSQARQTSCLNIDFKNIYHFIFESHLWYSCQIWYQSGT